jgi:Fe-S oxidoreductase
MNLVNEHRKKCTQCGECLEVCPRYEDLSLIENLYGYLEGKTKIEPDVLFRCLTCGLCAEACNEGLGIKMLVSPARKIWVRENGVSNKQTMMDPDAKNNIFRKISEIKEIPKYRTGRGSLVYFPGCAGTYINTNIAKATVALLESAGVDYTVLSGLEYCCGAVSAGAGNQKPILMHGQKNIEAVQQTGAKILITTCPGCFKAFKEIYPKMFGELNFEVLQVSQYLERLIEESKLIPEITLKHKVFYHDPCHLTRAMGVYREARKVLESIPGTVLANKTPENSACCGFGGGVRVNYPAESLSIALDRYRVAEKLGCDLIITNCGGCMQNIVEAGKNEKIKVFDLAEYLAQAFGIKVERDDKKMLEQVNWAYELCIKSQE